VTSLGARGGALAALLVAAVACTSSGGASATDGGADAVADAPSDAPDAAPACCPRSPQPAGCMDLGGARPDVGCLQACDFWCSTNWRVETDDAGCELWRYDVVYPTDGGTCFPSPPDSGSDATSDAPAD
jgi:hypothetical protein